MIHLFNLFKYHPPAICLVLEVKTFQMFHHSKMGHRLKAVLVLLYFSKKKVN